MLSKWWIPGGSHACPPSSLLEGHPPLDTPRSVDNPPEHEVGYALSARSLQARWVEISASLGSGSGCSATPLPPLAQRSISPGSLGRDLGFARLRQRLLRDAATSARSALDLSSDELFHLRPAHIVGVLLGRRLHAVRRRRHDRAADATVLGDLRRPDGVDDDSRGVRGVPDLELVLQAHRGIAEVPALEADERPLTVVEPSHVVRRADVDVAIIQTVFELRRHRLGLRALLRLEPVALEHVLEVHVAADVELVRAVDRD